MMRKQWISMMLCAGMAISLLAGNAGASETESGDTQQTEGDSEQVTGELNIVHYLSEPQKVEALDNLVSGFEKEYPGVKVNQESTTLENYQDVLKLKFSTGDVPDVLLGSPKTYAGFVESGNIQDLTDEKYVSRIQDSMTDNVRIDDKVYGIPLDVMANVVLYNKDIFSKLGLSVPTTYAEFQDVCKKLKDAGYDAAAAGYQDGISVGANFYTIFYGAPYYKMSSFEDEMLSGKKKAEDYPELAKALTQWREVMQYQNKDQRSVNTDRAEQTFANGDAAMLIIGTWGIGAVSSYNPDGNYGAFMYPSEDKAEDNRIPVCAGDCWMMVKDSPNHAAAEKFFEYMTRPDVNAQWCDTTQEISILKDVKTKSLPAAMQETADIISSGNVCNYAAGTVFSGQYFSSWGETLLEYAVTPDMTVDQFCSEVDDKFAAASK